MALIDFSDFTKRTLESTKGKLTVKEQGILKRLLTRTNKRNTILAQGLLSALKAGGASKKNISRFSTLLETANNRILEGKKPFTQIDENELARIFKSAHLPKKAEARFKHNVGADQDELLASQLANSIKREERRFEFVPERQINGRTPPRRPRTRVG